MTTYSITANPTPLPLRVAIVHIFDRSDDEDEDAEGWLWRTLDLCAAAEQRAHVFFNRDYDIPSALVTIIASFERNAPIMGPLATRYPALVRSLQELMIEYNEYDESVDLGAFAALATRLRALTFSDCGISSVRDLEGHCQYLHEVNLLNCRQMRSLDGLRERECLEEVSLSSTATTSLEVLSTCPGLTTVVINCCPQLHSLAGLEYHPRLRELVASSAPISTLEPLRTCPALTKVDIVNCQQLSSLEGSLRHHIRGAAAYTPCPH